jgi:hypothetical protein
MIRARTRTRTSQFRVSSERVLPHTTEYIQEGLEFYDYPFTVYGCLSCGGLPSSRPRGGAGDRLIRPRLLVDTGEVRSLVNEIVRTPGVYAYNGDKDFSSPSANPALGLLKTFGLLDSGHKSRARSKATGSIQS